MAWFRGQQLLEVNENVDIVRLHRDRYVLRVFDADPSDSGVYSCVAFNAHSERWRSFAVTVKGMDSGINYLTGYSYYKKASYFYALQLFYSPFLDGAVLISVCLKDNDTTLTF